MMQGLAETESITAAVQGAAMHRFAAELYPLCRSITGPGLRATLAAIQRRVPITIHAVPSGTPVLDWTVPDEWRIDDAYLADAHGTRVIDMRNHNLHVLNYSAPIHARMPLDALRPHLYTDPAHPAWIPYRTAYYQRTWGLCLSQQQLDALPAGEYEVCIASEHAPGELNYGELLVPGTSSDEVLISAHCCHPSLANDNLSGIAVAVALADYVQQTPQRLSYRFVFAPGTIGAITWLAQNRAHVDRIVAGLVLTCVGDAGTPTYKQSRRGDALIDRAVASVLHARGHTERVQPFSPYGYDERQFCSPGFNLPVGCLMRSPHGTFPEYHTSADNLDLITPTALADTLSIVAEVVAILEGDATYRNTSPYGEPQLGRRGLYDGIGGRADAKAYQMALLWVLNQSDGTNSLLSIAERANLPFGTVRAAADALVRVELLEEV